MKASRERESLTGDEARRAFGKRYISRRKNQSERVSNCTLTAVKDSFYLRDGLCRAGESAKDRTEATSENLHV